MTTSFKARLILATFAWIPTAALAAPAGAKQEFTLGKYVPQNCFVYIHGVHNPERDFIDAHWARVFTALKQTGIGDDIKNLIFSGAPAERRAEVEEGWDKAIKLLDGVRWGDLVGREVVFAERLTHVLPEIFLLCRSVPDSVDANVAGLKAIMDQIATLSGNMTVTESVVHEVKVWRLAAPDTPLAVFLLRKDDVVGLVMGEKALNEVAGLLSGKETQGSFVASARFKSAVADLPPPEDNIFFVDIKMLMGNLDGMFETAFKKTGGGRGPAESAPADKPAESEEAAALRVISKVVDQFNFFDYMVAVTRTDGMQEFSDVRVRIQSECTQKSLCKMFTSQRPFERFDKYIPKDATGFSLWDGLNLKELYKAVLDFIKNEAPGGPDMLAKWAEVQQDMGFDVDADFFSWWSGEMISVNLPPVVMSPFSTSDFVLMVRVKDPKLASEKINAGIDHVAALLKEHNQSLIIQEVKEVHGEGFRSVTHPMLAMMGRLIVGVADDHLILGSSPESINKCLDTAAGKAPSIVENSRFKAEGIIPKGPVCAASFTDLSNMGQEMAAAFMWMGIVNGFIPDEPDTKPIKAVFGMLGKISAAIQQIDFYSSQASVSEFDGHVWKTKQVLTYKPTPAPSQDVAQKP